MDALDTLEHDRLFRETLGSAFVDWYLQSSAPRSRRYLEAVTDWEQREYFDHF